MANSQELDEDDMGQLPEFHDSDEDDDLIALGGALGGDSRGHDIGESHDDAD